MPNGGCMDVNFTIFYADTPSGEYKTHTAQITGWPVHSRGRPWEFGAYGNWNPAPLVHPNGSIYLLAHTEQYGCTDPRCLRPPFLNSAIHAHSALTPL